MAVSFLSTARWGWIGETLENTIPNFFDATRGTHMKLRTVVVVGRGPRVVGRGPRVVGRGPRFVGKWSGVIGTGSGVAGTGSGVAGRRSGGCR